MKSSNAVSETSWLAGPEDSGATRPSWMAPSSPRLVDQASEGEEDISWVRPSQAPQTLSTREEIHPPAAPPPTLAAIETEPALPPPPIVPQSALEEVVTQNALELERREQSIAEQQEQIEHLQHQLDTALHTVSHLRKDIVRQSEGDLVKLALSMAKKLVGQELSQSPTLVTSWAKDALGRLADHDDLELCIAPDLAETITPELWFAKTGYEPVIDDNLDAGSCQIRWPEGHVNVSQEARLNALEQSLQPLLHSAGQG